MPTAGHKLRLRRDLVTRLRSNRVLDGVQLRGHGGTRWVKAGRLQGLTRELGWTGHRHWRRARLLAHLALGLVAYGLIECQRERLKLSFYQCRRRLIAGKAWI